MPAESELQIEFIESSLLPYGHQTVSEAAKATKSTQAPIVCKGGKKSSNAPILHYCAVVMRMPFISSKSAKEQK